MFYLLFCIPRNPRGIFRKFSNVFDIYVTNGGIQMNHSKTNGYVTLLRNLQKNSSPHYPSLLASQGLIRLLNLYESSLLEIPEQLLKVKVMVVLFQILSRTLQQQNEDGSWGVRGSREETSYAIITLANVDSLPFVTPVAGQIESAISRGRKYLKSINALDDIKLTPKDYIWTGKISYGVENVCHSYVLAAINTPVPQFLLGPRVSALVNIPSQTTQ